MKNKYQNGDFGYDDFFEKQRIEMGFGDCPVARVIGEYKGAYKVKNEAGEYLARITGKKMFDASSREDYPVVGDWVVIEDVGYNKAVIRGILPRKTMIKRRWGDKNKADEKVMMQIIATNIDVAFVVESVDRDFNLNRLERYVAITRNGGVEPVVILNKIDLIGDNELENKINQIKRRLVGIELIVATTIKKEGLRDLKKIIFKSKTYCFLGSSGVGKSTLINKLLGENIIKTGDISTYSGRGKHVTTKREMYFLENGGVLIDNPGIREVGLTDMGEGVDDTFDEVTSLANGCKFADCTHDCEPGCEVLAALESGNLDKGKYDNYVRLKKEVEYYEMTKVEKREKNRRFGKFIKKAKKQHRKFV